MGRRIEGGDYFSARFLGQNLSHIYFNFVQLKMGRIDLKDTHLTLSSQLINRKKILQGTTTTDLNYLINFDLKLFADPPPNYIAIPAQKTDANWRW